MMAKRKSSTSASSTAASPASTDQPKRLEGVPESHHELMMADPTAVYDPVDTYRELTEDELNPPEPPTG